MTNEEQLMDLLQKTQGLTKNFNSQPATNAAVAELAQIVADLIDIVHANAYRNGDPGQE